MASTGAGIETINVYDKYSDKDRLKIDSLADYKIDSYSEFMGMLRAGKKYAYTKRNNEGLWGGFKAINSAGGSRGCLLYTSRCV